MGHEYQAGSWRWRRRRGSQYTAPAVTSGPLWPYRLRQSAHPLDLNSTIPESGRRGISVGPDQGKLRSARLGVINDDGSPPFIRFLTSIRTGSLRAMPALSIFRSSITSTGQIPGALQSGNLAIRYRESALSELQRARRPTAEGIYVIREGRGVVIAAYDS